jgi:hypothetical protein
VADQNEFAIGATIAGHYGAETTGVTLAENDVRRGVERARRLRAGANSSTGPASFSRSRCRSRRTRPCAAKVVPRFGSVRRRGSSSSRPVEPRRFRRARDALNAVGGALFDVGASRIAWTIAGTQAATILAKACPLDFHPRAFAEGACAQSVFGRVNALFYRRAAAPVFTLLVARSLARDAWRTLCLSRRARVRRTAAAAILIPNVRPDSQYAIMTTRSNRR